MYRSVMLAAAGLCFTFAVGCGDAGPDLGTVTGQVTMDGQPLANALVTFTPAGGGGASTGVTDAQGNYTLGYYDKVGAMVGNHTVSVTTLPPAATAATEVTSDSADYEKQAQGGAATDYSTAAFVEKIPAKFNQKSELKYEVKAGSNVINLELKSS